jgi:HEAT repeat protein
MGVVWVVGLGWLLACGDASSGAPPETPSAPDAYAARGAPVSAARWDGPWRVQVLTRDPTDPSARAFADVLGVPVRAWNGDRLTPPAGTVALVWVASDADAHALATAGVAAGGGEGVAVLSGPFDDGAGGRRPPQRPPPDGDGRVPPARESWAARLPWAGLGVVDAAGELGLWADPSWAGAHPERAAQAAAFAVASHYAVPARPVSVDDDVPAGFAERLGGVGVDDAASADPRRRAAAAGDVAAAAWAATDPDPAVRLALAGSARDPAVRARLSRDADALVRARALDGVEDPVVLSEALSDGSSFVRVVAVSRLAELARAGSTAPHVEAALSAASRSPDAYVRWKAASGLRDVARLTALLAGDPDADVRREAARRLGVLGDPAGAAALVAALRDDNSFVRRWAAAALGRVDADGTEEALRQATQDPTGLVAAAAREALRARGLGGAAAAPWRPPGPPSDDAALDALLSSPDATVRKDGAKFTVGRPGALARLARLRDDPDSEVRKAAVEALGRGASEADREERLRALRPGLDDVDVDVRVTTLASFAALGRVPEAARARIIALAGDADTEIRLRAVEALAADPTVPSSSLPVGDPDERVRAAIVGRAPARLDVREPCVLVRRAAGRGVGILDAPGDDPHRRAWASGQLHALDRLLHARFSWNLPEDLPPSHRSLRPPIVRAFGHPDEG